MVKLIQEYFTNSTQKFPHKVAVNFKEEKITFRDFDSDSNKLARTLKSVGVKRGDRVCFCLPKSIDSIRSILAILKADGIYVPLDATAPRARLEQMVADAQPLVIICNSQTLELVGDYGRVFNLDAERSRVSSVSNDSLVYENDSADLAYILYTSGSTGQPKGVMITHANIINATDWAVKELGITSEDSMSQHPPLHFDLSTFDLYCAFKSGATLCLIPDELSLFPGQLLKFIEENKLTIWNSVPSVMVYSSLAGLVKPDRLPTIKKIFFNGESFPTKFLVEWLRAFPEKMFVNMYGPTEATVQCTYYIIKNIPTDLTKLVPIGKPCRNVEVFAVKENGERAVIGEAGELYVGGLGVGRGYWNNPKKTAASFLDFPGKGRVYKTGDLVRLLPDGNYEFIGRKDFQVKVMGHRIELGDIESALYSLPYIKEAGVITIPVQDTGGIEVIGFVSLREPKEERKIKLDLGQLLPVYAIPQKIKIIELLPRTGTGKIDRVSLKDHESRTKN